MNETLKCQHCGEEVALPFRCQFCNGYFCAEHRLPENHTCSEYWRVKAPHEGPSPIRMEREPTRPSYRYSITYGPQPAQLFWFSATELKHLTVGALLVMGVGLSFIPYVELAGSTWQVTLAGLAITFTLSFLLHELAHKFSAQHFGLWAEFRLTMQGALITIISMLLPFFKIISPGAVMIAGPATKATAGKTALSGPLTNIILSTIGVTVAVTTQNTFPGGWVVAVFGAWINALIAFFNLIPFGVMDGLKVLHWSKMVWSVVFVASLALMVYTYLPFL